MGKKVLILMMSALLLLVPFNSSGKTCASEQSENEANLFVLIPTEKGITREDFSLSVKDANVLREKLREIFKNSSTPREAYEKTSRLFKKYGVDLPPLEEIEKLTDDYPVYGTLSLLAFGGVGMGACFGLSAPPLKLSPVVAGAYPVFVVVGIYRLIMLGRGDVIEVADFDIVAGLNLIFIGILIGLQIPGTMVNFPIAGFGFSVFSYWLPLV